MEPLALAHYAMENRISRRPTKKPERGPSMSHFVNFQAMWQRERPSWVQFSFCFIYFHIFTSDVDESGSIERTPPAQHLRHQSPSEWLRCTRVID